MYGNYDYCDRGNYNIQLFLPRSNRKVPLNLCLLNSFNSNVRKIEFHSQVFGHVDN